MIPEIYRPMIFRLIEREGGYVNHKKDKGRATNWGITLATLSLWRDRKCTPADVQTLTKEEAAEIYYALYIKQPGYESLLDPETLELIFDFAVNSGPKTANIKLQETLNRLTSAGLVVDGNLGEKTRAAMRNLYPQRLYNHYIDARILYLIGIVVRDISQVVFLKGWILRALSFRK